jgi:hypothetical protein
MATVNWKNMSKWQRTYNPITTLSIFISCVLPLPMMNLDRDFNLSLLSSSGISVLVTRSPQSSAQSVTCRVTISSELERVDNAIMVIQQEANQSYVRCSPTKLSELILGKCWQVKISVTVLLTLYLIKKRKKEKKMRMDPQLKDCHILKAYHFSVCHTPTLILIWTLHFLSQNSLWFTKYVNKYHSLSIV